MADDLAKRFPEDTVVQFNYLSTIHVKLALSRYDASKAIGALQAAAPYEFTSLAFAPALYPIYVRGEAYLAAEQGKSAAAEFQKVLGHSGIVWNCWTGSFAHLSLARAYSLESRTSHGADADAARTRALTAYRLITSNAGCE